MRLLLTVFVFFSGVASAQLFSAGIKAGLPVTTGFEDTTVASPFTTGQTSHFFSDSEKFVAGGTVEVHLPLGFSIEADGLYHPVRLTEIITNAGIAATGKNAANYATWEVPILGKYRFPHTPLIEPYLAAGPSFRVLEVPLNHFMSNRGVTAGGGVEFKLSKLRVSPELRYTRWGGDSVSDDPFGVKSNQNQAELLVGLTF